MVVVEGAGESRGGGMHALCGEQQAQLVHPPRTRAAHGDCTRAHLPMRPCPTCAARAAVCTTGVSHQRRRRRWR
jgi:hypothetical protein